MSHIVIHDDIDGVTQYRQFDDLGNAVTYLEEQQNANGASGAKLFELNEVHFEVKSYVKIEIVDDDAPSAEAVEAAVPAVRAVEATPAALEPVNAPAPTAVAPDAITAAEDMSYVEAAMAEPIEAFASEAFSPPEADVEFAPPAPEMADATESSLGQDVRRGLFGR